MSAGKFTNSYWPGFILFLLCLVIAVVTYKDYGISWDEKIQKRIGEVSYDYVFNGDQTIKNFEDNRYGVGFELILTTIEKKCSITDDRQLYLMRHFVTHLFFLISIFCGYVLMQRLFKNQWLSCLGFLLMVFHPRIYAHSFYNTKDIPFLAAFLITLLVGQIAFEKNKRGWYVLLGICCGYAMSIRILGILPVLLFGMLFITDALIGIKEKNKAINPLLNLLVFLAATCSTTYIAWPALWEAPIHNFISFYQSASHFPWDGTLLFNGTLLHGKSLPWYYLPGWISITTPILWLALGLTGFILVFIAAIRTPFGYLHNTLNRNFLFYLLCCILPIAAVIILHSVVYDDWRHVYFIYPPFVILGLFVINKLAGKWKIIIGAHCCVQLIFTGYFIVANHPFQQVYFNEFVSHKDEFLRKNYDFEYWGCASKQGISYITAHDKSDTIRLLLTLMPPNNIMMLPASERKRIKLVNDIQKPTYFITNFRAHPDDYPYNNIVYELKVQNSTIMRVYKLDKGDMHP